MGACLAAEKCSEVLTKGTHGSTFGGNPMACAGGEVVIDKVTADGFLEDVTAKGHYFKEKLEKMNEVESVSGLGMMIGITLKNKKAADVAAKAIDEGLMLLTAKEKVRLLPPLNITYDEIDKGLEIFEKILNS